MVVEPLGVGRGQRRALVLIACAQLFALSMWFAASAVADALQRAWGIPDGRVSLLTIAVQAGFVLGAFGSALANLTDRVPARRLFAVSAVLGAAANACLLAVGEGGLAIAVLLRFVVGITLAGVYPSGMKAIAGWFIRGRGAALGLLVGALTVGSALPHLIRGLGLDWRAVLATASGLAVASALMMLAAGDGPFETATSSFSWTHIRGLARHQGYRLATLGYLGHMWELYAAWTWVTAYLIASGSGAASTWTFVVIAIGGPGAWLAGRLADRRGRTLAAGGSMVLSGSMAGLTALVFGGPGWMVMPVLLLWGFTVVSDSAQFSAMVTEVVDDEVRGTALTFQTALGFMLTLVSIWLVPTVAAETTWRFAFLTLVPGPFVGTLAMMRLRRSPWIRRVAGGIG